MEVKIEETRRVIYQNLTPWQRVQIARHAARPFALDYIQLSFTNFSNSTAIGCLRMIGRCRRFATMDEHRCVVIGHQKGRDLKENLKRNFGSANPEGYRKACG